MRAFNEEDYQKVMEFESKFRTAIDSRYVTGMTQDGLKTISVIYAETLNRQANLSCGGCVLQMMTQVGRLYFSYKETRVEDEWKKDTKRQKRKGNSVGKSNN